MNKQTQTQQRIGIDIGKVIMSPVAGGKSDTTFLSGDLKQAMATPPSPGAFEGVARLVETFGRQNVWLVSKAGPGVQRKTWFWLEHHDFYARTGLKPAHVRFCLRRDEKAGHCEALGINYFIDDRLDVLDYIKHCVEHRYLFGEQPNLDITPDWVTPVADWETTVSRVLEDLTAETTTGA
ncbi:MAG: hypothetical protein OEZ39_17040 [Gammaproteobacteria bacterium]|nr:hypothetical protein [Gammaproteobacteria bacterium]MDH5653568.1 hypothetical protein [Gammaproteobacteria bacterium]